MLHFQTKLLVTMYSRFAALNYPQQRMSTLEEHTTASVLYKVLDKR